MEGLGKFKNILLIGTRTLDLPACSIAPQPTTLPRAPWVLILRHLNILLIAQDLYDRNQCSANVYFVSYPDILAITYIFL
jgi:hypothetical protein